MVDTNIIVAQVIPLDYSAQASQLLTGWFERNEELLASVLWSYEITSALRKAAVVMSLSAEQINQALDDVLALGIREVSPTAVLHHSALAWAAKLGQTVAYDAAFLVLAESIGADFWTADRRLATLCQGLGLAWVHLLGQDV